MLRGYQRNLSPHMPPTLNSAILHCYSSASARLRGRDRDREIVATRRARATGPAYDPFMRGWLFTLLLALGCEQPSSTLGPKAKTAPGGDAAAPRPVESPSPVDAAAPRPVETPLPVDAAVAKLLTQLWRVDTDQYCRPAETLRGGEVHGIYPITACKQDPGFGDGISTPHAVIYDEAATLAARRTYANACCYSVSFPPHHP